MRGFAALILLQVERGVKCLHQARPRGNSLQADRCDGHWSGRRILWRDACPCGPWRHVYRDGPRWSRAIERQGLFIDSINFQESIRAAASSGPRRGAGRRSRALLRENAGYRFRRERIGAAFGLRARWY